MDALTTTEFEQLRRMVVADPRLVDQFCERLLEGKIADRLKDTVSGGGFDVAWRVKVLKEKTSLAWRWILQISGIHGEIVKDCLTKSRWQSRGLKVGSEQRQAAEELYVTLKGIGPRTNGHTGDAGVIHELYRAAEVAGLDRDGDRHVKELFQTLKIWNKASVRLSCGFGNDFGL